MKEKRTLRKKISIGFPIIIMATVLAFSLFYLKFYKNKYVENPIVVIIPSYNNIKWFDKNLSLLKAQNKRYNTWRAIYIDDCSKDGTPNAVEKYIRDNNLENQITLIKNKERKGSLENVYNAAHSCKNNEIIVICDGDDFLHNENVLNYINYVYQDKQVWMTYGQYEIFPSGQLGQCQQIPEIVIDQNGFRDYKWVSSHLRTFRASLFKRIKKEDLLFQGKFFPVTTDMAAMFPMLEMAGKHAKFIPKTLYVYNQDNPINNYKTRLNLQLYLDRFIRSKERYETLETLET
ncbi:glycosyltransferase family 2 protein [Candidatus Dependentiae bacterium]